MEVVAIHWSTAGSPAFASEAQRFRVGITRSTGPAELDNLPVTRGKAPGADGRWYYNLKLPDGTNISWFPNDGRGGSELRMWRKGYDIATGDGPKQGNGGETLNVWFILDSRW